jgi:hypothetical protein
MMDANEAMGKDKRGVSTITSKCNLINIHTAKHHEAAITATYARGTQKIDYILISPELLPLIRRSGLLPFYHGIHMDQRGQYIDIDEKALLYGKIAELYSQPTRILTSKFPKTVLKYKTELWKQLQAHNILARSEAIQNKRDGSEEEISQELNNIANTIQTAMLSAKKKCTKPPAPPYSVKLASLNKIIRFWKTVKSSMTTGRNVDAALKAIMEKIPTPMHHMTIKTTTVNSHIRKAVNNYRKAIPNARKMRQEQNKRMGGSGIKTRKQNDGTAYASNGKCQTHKGHVGTTPKCNKTLRPKRHTKINSTNNKQQWRNHKRPTRTRTMDNTYRSARNRKHNHSKKY